jgi:type II secretory pathway component PulJ
VTLTEVVVASTLLAVAIVPLLRALTVAQTTSTVIERKTQCLILAEATLEEIRAKALHHYESSFGKDSEKLVGAYLCHVTDDQNPTLRLVTVAVGCDVNSNGDLSTDEVEAILATYIAKRQ